MDDEAPRERAWYSAWWLLALEKGGMKGGTAPVVAFFLECTRDKPRNLFSALCDSAPSWIIDAQHTV
jgi:hypothetical protein